MLKWGSVCVLVLDFHISCPIFEGLRHLVRFKLAKLATNIFELG